MWAFSPLAHATVDGGSTSTLLALAGPEGRYAIIVDSDIQENCDYQQCPVYVLDTHTPGFSRMHPRLMRARVEEIEARICGGLNRDECGRAIQEELADPALKDETVVVRYLRKLPPAAQKRLLPVVDPPELKRLKVQSTEAPQSHINFLSDDGAKLNLRLEERWTVPSFRAGTGDDFCPVWQIPACQTTNYWVDGVKQKHKVCPSKKVPTKRAPHRFLDCAGRASIVRIVGSWEKGPSFYGNSNLVAPGALAQDYMMMVARRHVDLRSLQFADHSVVAYVLPKSILILGAFGHGIYANGTWFPATLVVPLPSTGSSSGDN